MNANTILLLLAVIVCTFFACGTANEADYSAQPPAICHHPLITGPCRAYKPRFGYDMDKKACVKFIYGGCEGNENNFVSKEMCQTACELPDFE